MILIALLRVIGFIINPIFTVITYHIPDILGFNSVVDPIIVQFFNIVDYGCTMFYFLLGPVATVLVTYIVVLEILKHIIDVIAFVVRKIPLAIDW